MKLNTDLLKGMLNTVSKCKPNQLLEITSYYNIKAKNNRLVLTATDSVNYIECIANIKSKEEFEVIVKAEQFAKLISKTTSKEIELKIEGDSLVVRGNGTYKVEIFTEEEYPSYEMNSYKVFNVRTKPLLHALNVAKNIKSEATADGILYNYLIRDDKLIATDSLKISYSEVKGFEENLLLPPGLANLLDSITDESCEVSINEDNTAITFKSEGVFIYGALEEGEDEFPDVVSLFEDELPYSVELDTVQLLGALDRLKLFISKFDNALIDIIFTSDFMTISTLSGSVEVLSYSQPLDEELEYECTVNSNYLQSIIKSMREDKFNLEFGAEDILKFICKDEFILALADGDDE